MKRISMHDLLTPRLHLRKVQESDLQNYHQRLTSDPQVAAYMLWNANHDIAHTKSVILKIKDGYTTGSRYHWAITLQENDSLIGTIALLNFDESENSCSFAYMLGKDYWGNGYAAEALTAVLKFAFEELEISLILADHFEENTASGAVMEKVGMHRTGILPSRYEKNGRRFNAVQFQLKKSDFFKNNT